MRKSYRAPSSQSAMWSRWCVELVHSEWKHIFNWAQKTVSYSVFIFSMRTTKRWTWWGAQPHNFHTKRGEANWRCSSLQACMSTWANTAIRVAFTKTQITGKSKGQYFQKAFYCVFRQQEELEMAECESKYVSEDHNDENIQSPFQPITNETSVVSVFL